jgi:hypothetical protein
MIIIVAIVYFIPSMLAITRGRYRHGRPGRVFLLNLLFGWTIIGWFATLLYVACGEKLSERQHRELVEAVSAATH